MFASKTCLSASTAFLLVAAPLEKAIAEDFNPVDVMATFHKFVRDTIDPSMPPTHWLSLSMVGSVAEEGDQPAINDIANFCPPPRPIIDVFGNVRRLDGLYEDILKGMTGPQRPIQQNVSDARAKITDQNGNPTPLSNRYWDYRNRLIKALSDYFLEPDKTKKALLLGKVSPAETKWKQEGGRRDFETAMWVIEKNIGKFSDEKNGERFGVLAGYRNAGLTLTDAAAGTSYRSPASELSPSVEQWKNESGWTKVSFSNNEYRKTFDATYTSNKGFGGLHIGFLNVMAAGGGGKNSERRVNNVTDFAVSFDIKRVQIRRPWLDTEVFFQPTAWTWKKNENTSQFPHVAAGVSATGDLVVPDTVTYDNTDIGCSILPIELLIARNRSLTMTVSNSDYEMITTSGSSGGGGGLFGIFGGGASKKWETTNVKDNGSSKTFTVTSPGTSVIGMISEALPGLPNPNPTDTWGDEAWIEKGQ